LSEEVLCLKAISGENRERKTEGVPEKVKIRLNTRGNGGLASYGHRHPSRKKAEKGKMKKEGQGGAESFGCPNKGSPFGGKVSSKG